VIYKVLTQKGAEGWDSISVGWEPWHQLRPEIRVRVITPDYAEHALEPKNINETPAHEGDYKIYSDGSACTRRSRPSRKAWWWRRNTARRKPSRCSPPGMPVGPPLAARRIPVAHSHVEFDSPTSLPLRTTTVLLDNVKPQRTAADGRVKLIWDLGRLEGVESTRSLPSA